MENYTKLQTCSKTHINVGGNFFIRCLTDMDGIQDISVVQNGQYTLSYSFIPIILQLKFAPNLLS